MSSWLLGVSFFVSSSVSVHNGFGLQNKLRDGPLHNEKARGCFFSPCALREQPPGRIINPFRSRSGEVAAKSQHEAVSGGGLPNGHPAFVGPAKIWRGMFL